MLNGHVFSVPCTSMREHIPLPSVGTLALCYDYFAERLKMVSRASFVAFAVLLFAATSAYAADKPVKQLQIGVKVHLKNLQHA